MSDFESNNQAEWHFRNLPPSSQRQIYSALASILRRKREQLSLCAPAPHPVSDTGSVEAVAETLVSRDHGRAAEISSASGFTEDHIIARTARAARC